MGLSRRRNLKKWLILGLTCLLIPLFQNMSLTDQKANEFIDIRETAPRKPSGSWQNPKAAYFPV
jgi:hypothetical protein